MASITAIGSALVADFVNQLELQGVSLPERQHFAPGQIPAMDGEQLVGNLVGVMQGQPGGGFGGTFPAGGAPATFSATYSVALLREIPVVQGDGGMLDYVIPASADINTAGVGSLEDAEALLKACQAIHRQYLVTGRGMGFEVGPLQTIGPEGGLAGPKILLTVSIG